MSLTVWQNEAESLNNHVPEDDSRCCRASTVTVNVLSLFGFVLVLGIVVDDAIILGENIYRHQEEHGDGIRGSIEGAYEIAKPVTFAVLTTVAAFSPLLFVPGMMGKIFRVIPLVVIPCLLFSLVESLNILPAHLSHTEARPSRSVARRFQSRFADGLKRFVQAVYCPVLETALRLAVPDSVDRRGRHDRDHRPDCSRGGRPSASCPPLRPPSSRRR